MAIPDPELIRKWNRKALIGLIRHCRTYSDANLRKAIETFNGWNWPGDIFGATPEGWETLPRYRKPWMPEDTLTKADYIRPYWYMLHIALDRSVSA